MNGHEHTADDPDCHDTSCGRTAPSHHIHPDPAVRQLVAREVAAERERIAEQLEARDRRYKDSGWVGAVTDYAGAARFVRAER